MRQKKIKLSALLLFIGLTGIQAQNSIPSSGGNASGSGGTVSYSIGQIVYTTNSGIDGSAAQGVQQPFEISAMTGIEEAFGISLEIIIYPNPSTDFINLKIENYEIENLRYQLYDINGILLLGNKIENKENSISIHNLLPATYFLKVMQGNRDIKTFKVIKK